MLEDLEQQEEEERRYQLENTDENGNCSQDLAEGTEAGVTFITAANNDQTATQVEPSGNKESKGCSLTTVPDGNREKVCLSEELGAQPPGSVEGASTVEEAETSEQISLKPGMQLQHLSCD